MSYEVFDTEAALTLNEILEAQRKLSEKLGKTLPQSYIDFLLVNNGGRIRPDLFNIKWAEQEWADGEDVDMLDGMFSIYDDDGMNLIEANTIGYNDRIPADTLAIGQNSGRSLILIGIGESNLGQIFYWHGEYEKDEDDESLPDYYNVGFVANTLSAFLDGLYEG